jgi:1,2-beta-oligoglucan phosphorylase
VAVSFVETGVLERLDVGECAVLLYPASALEDGLGGLWLRRRRGQDIDVVSLIGQTSPSSVTWSASGPDLIGTWAGLDYRVSFRLGDQQAAWFWHVSVTNADDEPAEVDLVFAQDVALAPPGAVRTNEYYVSQYLDLTPVEIDGHGPALGVRQNMPGPTPWCLVGSLGRTARWATDALQLTRRGRRDGAPWPGLSADLPSHRLQHEHTVAALQGEAIALAPGESITTGFFGIYLPDHPEATGASDARHAERALADPAAKPPDSLTNGQRGGESSSAPSLFADGALATRALTDAEVDRLAGSERRHVEQVDGTLHGFFTADRRHVVTAAKQAAVLRPHGHLMRSGTSLLPDEPSVCVTAWMDGTFCSHLTQGHVALGVVVSHRRSYLGLNRAHGLRIFVAWDDVDDWQLLGTPSAWSIGPGDCRWWYAYDRGLLQVTTTVPPDRDACDVDVQVLEGDPCTFLAAVHLPWLEAGGDIGTVAAAADAVWIQPPGNSATASIYDDPRLAIRWTPGSVAEVADDSVLFGDGRSRGLPWVTLRSDAAAELRLVLEPHLVERASIAPAGPTDFWESMAASIQIETPDTDPGRELARIATALPWFAHDALIHYLSPRGLEQYSGGAWGSRDVTQGPVGLLLALSAHDELRELLLVVFSAQNQRGDWPQAFDFLARHQRPGQSDAHGDVVYWPLLALGAYLRTTGDQTILAERVPSMGDIGPTRPDTVAEHVGRALAVIESTIIGSTHLPAYGHGDWNDSLQPADPAVAARLCSTWTVVLQAEALTTFGEAATSEPELAARALRIAGDGAVGLRTALMPDGILAGYGLFDDDGSVEPLLHPRDHRTGLCYSLLPMIHAIVGELLSPEEAAAHLDLIRQHLLGPDGAHLFDRPVAYHGGPMELFQRAEASTFFGREIGVMYMHAHLRYAEALARVGDAPALLRALALAQPIGVTDRVPGARPRQSTCYFSSSDAAFDDRYQADAEYGRIADGTVALEGGWRVYSSGSGLFLQLVVQNLLGIRVRGERVEIDPVLDPGLDGLTVTVPVAGSPVTFRFTVGPRGHGGVTVRVGGRGLPTQPLFNRYRDGGCSVLRTDLVAGDDVVEVEVA